ncbi:MAG: FHA domain-containing protein [Gemmatimonas sp.]|nr:FHA domain-containing protein [Gemmatimonas sp.]
MNARLEILSGARAGESIALSGRSVTVGRHPGVEVRFDPETERSVSARHALLFQRSRGWFVRDLGSRNGTQLNGRLVKGEVPLSNGDRLTFGADGPTAQFSILIGAANVAAGGRSSAFRQRILHPRALAGVAVMSLIAAYAALMTVELRREAAWDLERESMRLRIDSLQWSSARTVEALEHQLLEVTISLERSSERVRALEDDLSSAEGRGESGRDEVQELRRELQRAMTSLQGQQATAELDFRTIQDHNRPAIARIFVEYENGQVITATAFAVRPDATLVTNRHVVEGESGELRPRRIAIQFSDSDQIWPARLLHSSDEADLAMVKVDNILGDIPTVRGISLRPDTLPSGAPIAMLGYPLGGAPPTSGAADDIARPYLAAGIIRSVAADRVEVQGYGAVGASGSPIFDARGEVVAIVFGGRAEDESYAVFGVPSPAAVRLLGELQRVEGQ